MNNHQQEAKQYLRRIRTENLEIQALTLKRAEKRASLLPAAIRYDRDKVQTSPVDNLSETVTELSALDDEIARHVHRLDREGARAMRITGQIEDPACRMVIELYYLTTREDGRLRGWEDVAAVMGYSEKHVLHKVHPKALHEFARLLKEDTK